MGAMDRLRDLLGKPQEERDASSGEYDPLVSAEDEDGERRGSVQSHGAAETPFDWLEYMVFLLLGIAMLWAWYVAFHSHFYLKLIRTIGTCS